MLLPDRYMTQACRIQSERHTRFPFTCPLSHVMRVAKLFKHDGLKMRHSTSGELLRSGVREHSFLDNPRTPEEIKVRRMSCPWARARERERSGGEIACARACPPSHPSLR